MSQSNLKIYQPTYPAPTAAFTSRDMDQVNYAIVHHAVTSLKTSPEEIDQMHRARGFIYIGYHLLVNTYGEVFAGRPLSAVPAAAQGYNADSVDICLIGNFQSDEPGYNGPPTHAQYQALIDALVYVHQQVPSIDKTVGHGDLMADACPGDIVKARLPSLKEQVYDILKG